MPKLKNIFSSKKETSKEDLKTLLKARLPAVFEREPAPAYAEGKLDQLVEDILAL